MKFIPDEEILLNNENDLLSQKKYVFTLKKIISNIPSSTEDSFTIGLFGEWGSGKSSIIKTAEKELCGSNDRIKFIIYDAWKYVNDSFRRMLLLKMQQELNFDKTDLMHSFYINGSEDVDIKKKFKWGFFLFIAVIALIAIIFVYNSDTSTDNKITLSILVSVGSMLIGSLRSVFDEFKVNINTPHLFAPEQFEECFNEIIQKALHGSSITEKIGKWVQIKSARPKLDKIIIVIDNIDRCQKELAYELLTNIKNFLGKYKDVIFIIPVDDEALKNHIRYSTQNGNSTESNEFLRKFFNVTLRLKKLKRYDIYCFAKQLNDNYSLGFKSTTIDLIGKEFASNPRRIIQLYNNLNAEFQNYENDFVIKYESIICKLIILRDEWFQYYNKICSNPYLLNSPDSETEKLIKETQGLDSFLKKTNSITQSVDLRVISRITSNEDNFTGIPDSVIEAIESLDEEVVSGFIRQDDKKYSLLLDFIIENLKSYIDNSREMSVLNYFKVILFINHIKSIESYDNYRIQNEIKTFLPKFLNNGCDGYEEEMIRYSEDLVLQNLPYLKDYLLQVVVNDYKNDNYENIAQSSKDILIEMLDVYKDNSVKKLQNALFVEFKNNDYSLSMLLSNEINIPTLIDDNIKDFIIESIIAVNSEDKMLKELVFISRNYSFLKEDLVKLFTKVNSLSPNFNKASKENLISLVKMFNDVLKNVKRIGVCPELETVYKSIISRNNGGVIIKITKEIFEDPDSIPHFISFIFNIYRITLNKVNTVLEFNELYENPNSYETTKNKILEMINVEKLSLGPMQDFILKDTNYDNKTLDLLNHFFTYKSDDKYQLPQDKLKSKLNEIITSILAEENALLTHFLEQGLVDDRFKSTLIEIITEKSKDDILKLPTSLQKLAFDYICSANRLVETYQDATDLLKAISLNGKEEHIRELTNVIAEKLIHKNSKIAFELIDSTKNFSSSDKHIILSHLNDYSDDEEIDPRIIDNAILKLKDKRTDSIFDIDENDNSESE